MLRSAVTVSLVLLLWTLAAPVRAEDVTKKPDQAVADSAPRPSIDLAFAFSEADTIDTVKNRPQVAALAQALSDAEFRTATFVIACHVKVPGSPAHNLELSDRCAGLVRQVLVEQYGLSPQALIAVGLGETKLKNPQQPMAAENQRLQILNMDDKGRP
jgi:outer membrane protein OmpA-like peptidoglycan-associated protein